MGRLKILSRGSQTKLLCYMMLFSLFVFFVIYWIIKLRWCKLVWAWNLFQLMSWGTTLIARIPTFLMALSSFRNHTIPYNGFDYCSLFNHFDPCFQGYWVSLKSVWLYQCFSSQIKSQYHTLLLSITLWQVGEQ